MIKAKDIGARMRKLRRALNLTQAQAAARAGFPISQWGQLEIGCHYPSIPRLAQIAEALECSPGELLP